MVDIVHYSSFRVFVLAYLRDSYALRGDQPSNAGISDVIARFALLFAILLWRRCTCGLFAHSVLYFLYGVCTFAPVQDVAYDASKDPILRRVLQMLGET